MKIGLALAAVLWLLSAPCDAEEPPEALEAQAGGTAALPSHVSSLWGEYEVLWTAGLETLVQIEKGEHKREPPGRYSGRVEVDHTGSLHITGLEPQDSGLYQGQIINGNNTVHRVHYNLTVLKAAHTNRDQGLSSAAAQRHWTIPFGFVLFFIVFQEYLF